MKKLLLLATAAVCAGSGIATAAAPVDFVKDIQPIFQKSCVSCHGPEKQKGGLRLDRKDDALKGGKDGVVIIAGGADKSDLYRRITLAPGSDDIMPSKGDLLTKAQADLIKDWINQGANWPAGAVAKDEASGESAAVSLPFADLAPIKSSGAETAAIAKLAAAGVDARPVAMNVSWREANFHSLGTNATDTTLAPLKDMPSVVDLNLAGTKITDAGLQHIENLTNLVNLHLELTRVTDAGLAHLKKMPHLAYLNLYGTMVTDKGMEQLSGLAGLKKIYLWQTKVTDRGATALQKSLPKLQISRGWEKEPAAAKPETKAEPKKEEKPAAK